MMLSSALGPKPLSLRIFCSWAAVRNASSESICSSSNSRRARLGPSPGSRVISTSPGGNFARSFTSAGISPVSASEITFSWMIAPIPGSSVARPWRARRGDRDRRLADRLGRVAVGDDPVDHGSVELVQIAELVKRLGDLDVGRIGRLLAGISAESVIVVRGCRGRLEA